MTVYDIPNIEHCDVTTFATSFYRIYAHEGWYMYIPSNGEGEDEYGNPTKIYKTVIIIRTNYDFSQVEIIPEAELPSNAEICGDVSNPDHEVM